MWLWRDVASINRTGMDYKPVGPWQEIPAESFNMMKSFIIQIMEIHPYAYFSNHFSSKYMGFSISAEAKECREVDPLVGALMLAQEEKP